LAIFRASDDELSCRFGLLYDHADLSRNGA